MDELLLRMGFFVKDAAGALTFAEDNTAFLSAYETIMGPCIDAYKGYVNGYAILPILAGGTSFLLSWVSMQQQNKNKKETDANNANNQAANMGKGMMYIMPAMSVFFCWQYDATFSIYWILSNVRVLLLAVRRHLLHLLDPQQPDRDRHQRHHKQKASRHHRAGQAQAGS